MKPVAFDVAVFVGACLAVNALLVVFAPAATTVHDGDPPGWLVGCVWTVLFAFFGWAHGRLRRTPGAGRRARSGVALLALFCLAYPLYTLGLTRPGIGLAGNIVTGAAAAVLAARLLRLDGRAALLVLPVVPWLVFASWTLVGS